MLYESPSGDKVDGLPLVAHLLCWFCCDIVCVWYTTFMASCVVFEFKYMGTCLFPVVLLGVQIQVWFVGGHDFVVKLFLHSLYDCSFGPDSCMFGFGMKVDGMGVFSTSPCSS